MRGLKFRPKVLKSFRLRIFMILIVVSVVPMFLLGSLLQEPIEQSFVQTKMDRLLSQCNIIRNHLISQDYLDTGKSESIDAELAQLSSMYDGRVLIINDKFTIIKDTYVMDEGKTSISGNVIRCYRGENISYYSSKDHYIEIALSLTNENKHVIGVLMVTFSTLDVEENLDRIESRMLVAESVIAIIELMISFFLARKLVKPFDTIEASIDKISNGYFDEKLSLDGYKETEEIADAFNTMLLKMKQLDESRQEFVSNVSHELKTPITSIKVLADSLLVQEEVPLELYQEFMGDIAEEIERENKIITDLLALVKMDKKASNLNIEPVDVNDLLELILKRLRPIAARKNIEMVLESFRPVTAEVDTGRLTQAFSNLVENAIKYNKENGWVHVSLDADHKFFYVKVMDSGMGIPEESIDYIFERFYRVDKSHSSEIDGTGLGLAIVKSAILIHKGAIKVSSQIGEGTTFSVRIPLNYIA